MRTKIYYLKIKTLSRFNINHISRTWLSNDFKYVKIDSNVKKGNWIRNNFNIRPEFI